MTNNQEDAVKRERFFDLLRPVMLEVTMEQIRAAYELSRYGHMSQQRDDGSNYFYHPLAVATIICEELEIFDPDIIITALLHDIVEDSTILSEYRIALNFDQDVALWVKFLTKESGVNYHQRLKKCRIWQVLLVKLADRLHNLRELNNCQLEKQRRKLAETKDHYFDLCELLVELMPEEFKDHGIELKNKILELCRQIEQQIALG